MFCLRFLLNSSSFTSKFSLFRAWLARAIYFPKIKHISFHGFVFQATVKLITRALIVIVAPFGESPGACGQGGGKRGEEWIGEEYILVRAANCQGSDSKHESGSCIGGCRGTTEAAKPINRPDLSKAATSSSTSLAPHINPFLTNWQPPAYFSQ